MEPRWIKSDDPEYPPSLKQNLDGRAPSSFAVIGDPTPILGKTIGLICSIKCPGSVIIKTYDAIREIRDAGITVIGGFHSPMEKECLSILLRGQQPVVICPARSLAGMQIPKEWHPPIEVGRLVLVSPFPPTKKRATADLAVARNKFAAALSSVVLVAHASPGGRVMSLVTRLVDQRKRLWSIDDPDNMPLKAMGTEILPADLAAVL